MQLARNPQIILAGLGAGLAVWAWSNPAGFASLLVKLGFKTVEKVGEAAVEVASEYGAPALAAKAGDSLAYSSAGTWLREAVGLPDLNADATRAACAAALEAGDDLNAARYCGPLQWAGGWFDGK